MEKNWKEKGTQQFKKNNYHKALQCYRKYLEQEHSDNFQALFNISICYFKLQEFETAIGVCDQALALDQKYAKCYYRRALCRKELLTKDPGNAVQKYKFIYDCKMFEKYCNKDEVAKQLEELKNQSNERKQQLLPCQALHLSRFQRDLMQLQRENINLYAISWLDLKQKERKSQLEDKRQKINGLYKQLIVINRKKEHSEEQKKTLSELIKSKIKQLKSHVIEQKSIKKLNQSEIYKNSEGLATDTESIDQNNSDLKNNQNKQKSLAENELQKSIKTQVNSNKNIVSEDKQQAPQIKTVKKKVDDEVKKKQTQKIKAQQNLVKQKKIQELTPQLIYKVYFVDNLQKSRDVFQQFGKNLLLVLNNQGLNKQKKEQLLIKIQKVKKSQMKVLMKGAPKQLKEQINQALTKSDIKQEIKKLYLFK